MTVLPCDVAAAPAGPAPVGANDAAPGDFMAALLAAMTPSVEEGVQEAVSQPPHAAEPDVEPVETPAIVIDPALAALVAQQIPFPAPSFETGRAGLPQPTAVGALSEATSATVPTAPPLVEEGALAPVSKPGDKRTEPSTPTPEPAVAGRAAVTKEPASVHAEVPSPSNAAPNLPATAIQPSSPQPTAPAAATAPVTPPVANTNPLDRVSAQVFPEVTGLVSRGNGTHRITMTLNPEQLGEVRVVMTVRDGTVHVRMAAGNETRAALLNGSPELTRLLESAGATDTRIFVRELPAAPISPTNPNSTNPSSNLNNGSLDQHAGTRADHQAKDGSDQNTPRPVRAEGATSTGPAPRSIQSVIGTRTAGVDLTM